MSDIVERLRQKNKNLADNCYELRQENERLTAENALLLEQHAEVHANYNQAQDVIMSLRAAIIWVMDDMAHKAPEQAADAAQIQYLRLQAALNQSEQDAK